MRLIDIEAPCKIEIELDGEKCHATVTAPTVDAIPVVRCKDCKYYWKNNSKYKSNMEDLDDLMMCLASPSDDAFCSEGERKDDAEQV